MACAHSLPRCTRRGLGLRAVRSAGRKANEKLIAKDQQVNELLSTSEQWLRDVVDNTTAVIFVKDLQDRFLLTNREFERRFGVQREQIRGKTDLESLPHQIAQLIRGGDRQIIETGAPSQFEEALTSIEGERYYVVAKFLLPDSGGKPCGLCGIAMDITAAKQSAILEERTRLAREIHDALTQSFAGIVMELEVAEELLVTNEGDPLEHIQLAHDGAMLGLAEARRSVLSLQPTFVETCGLIEALRTLVERSKIPGRLRCDFRSDKIPEKNLSPGDRQELLRIAQEAISNAIRHAKPTVITVTLRWERPNLLLNISDNGLGMAKARLQKGQGFGLVNMRARASKLGGNLEIQSATGRGTSIVVSVPIAS